ncbi:MAG TPA: DUF899 family protein [Gemmatimonadaceae bacterium]|jgi:predicted dithiol-disulfide oxidoreductase (DUF899 family)|nr:DUF899 family protein [Gemmatimonadaceae bacterium]
MVHFPGESAEYRAARDVLLQAEAELRQHTENVAARRRALPLGGALKEDYTFETMDEDPIRLSDLFREGRNSLVVYNYMYGPAAKRPCVMCTSMLDALDGETPHIEQRVNLAVVAKSPPARIREVQKARGWRYLPLLSSARNSYNADYLGEDAAGGQWPMLNVFTRRDGAIYHTYGTELLYAPHPKGMDTRHIDAIWPLWNVLDFTPEGRGRDWSPKLAY